MIAPLLVTALLFAPATAEPTVALTRVEDVAASYAKACEARDAEALAKLWKNNPMSILPTFDADLEASLRTWEASPDSPDAAAIAKLHDRAQWAARIASEVTGRPIFADYAASFVGWNPEEKARFRGGQKAYGQAMRALQEGDAEKALEAARECTGLAMPLGDWWGSAMGLGAEGQALLALERHPEALLAASRARLLNQQLGLGGAELSCLGVMLKAAKKMERTDRALVCARDAEALAKKLGVEEAMDHFARARVELEELLGK